MSRVLRICALALPGVMLGAAMVTADVKTRDRAQLKFESRVLNFFMGKAAKEGIESTVAVKGSRKATMNDATGRIVDLAEEKVYDLDVHRKTYTVKTFAQIRQEMRDAEERAKKNAEREPGGEKPQQQKPEREMEVDVDVKETGQHKQVAGYDSHESIVTITVREKGKTLEESGGLVMTTDTWLGPQVPQMKEVAAFDMKFWRAIQGPEAAGMSAEQMAAVIAMYPMVRNAMERMQKEGPKLQGTPLASTTTFEGVKSQEQMAQQKESGGGGGIGGMLARRMKKSDDKPRATIFTINHEVLEVATAVAPTDVAIPAGFSEKK